MLLVWTFLIFLVAAGLILWSTLQCLRFAGMALNPNRPQRSRLIMGAAALASGLGVLASAAAGFMGIGALWFSSQGGSL